MHPTILILLASLWDSLIRLDESLLLAINGCNAPFLDRFLWNISVPAMWIPLYIAMVVCIVRRYGKKSLWIMLAFAVCVGLSDYISSGIIKHWVERPRPTHTPHLQQLLHYVNGYKGGMYGFVSSHAANTICCTLLYSLIWKNKSSVLSLSLWTILTCWSRMYLGAHYPADILGGLLVGAALALVGYMCLRKKNALSEKRGYPPIYGYIPTIVFLTTLVVCCFL